MFPIALVLFLAICLMLAFLIAAISEVAVAYDPWYRRVRRGKLLNAGIWLLGAFIFAIAAIQAARALQPHLG